MFNETNSIVIKYPREITIFASICAVIFCIVGITGNLVTIIALIRCPKLRGHATTAFVLSLCVSDLLFCSVNLPLTASRFIHEAWTLGDSVCKLFPVLFYGNVAVSLLNMVAITLNRYILVSCHQYYRQFYTPLSIWLQLLSCWVFAVLIMLPPLLGVWGQLGLDPSTFSCTILEKNGTSPKKMIFLIGFVLPCIVIIVSYSCIFFRVKKTRKKLMSHVKTSSSQESRKTNREKEDNRLTKLMLLIFICFLLCFLPLMIMNVFDDSIKYPVLHVVASIMAWASSVINPFIYAASNRQYRTAYSKFFALLKGNALQTHNNTRNSMKNSQHFSNKMQPSSNTKE